MAGGRPTKYEQRFCDDLVNYFDTEPYRQLEDMNGKEYLMPNHFPTLAGWCAKNRISRQTMHEWVKVHDEFSDAYKIAKEMQEHILINGGISGAFATAFSVFTAKNAIGWRDKPADEETADPKPIEIKIVDARNPE